MFACTPGSLKLGGEPETGSEDGSEGTDGLTSGVTDASVTTGGPGTTGEPAPEGVLEWEELLDDSSGYAMAVGPDGTIVVVGERGFTSQGDGGIFASRWFGKFAPDGEQLWLRETPNTEESYPISLAVSVGPAGEIFVAVVDYTTLEGGANAVSRHTPDGEEVWSIVVPARVGAVRATPEGGVIAGGMAPLDDHTGIGWVRALDADGATLWEKTYAGADHEYTMVRSIAVAGDDIVLAGSLGTPPDGHSAAWLHRAVRSSGAQLWDQTVTASEAADWAEEVGVAADGSILALVTAGGAKTVRAYAPTGAALWSFAPELATAAAALAVASDGSFTVTDGKVLPLEDPDACYDGFGPCAVSMQIERRGFDRSLQWEVVSDTCQSGQLAATMPNDGVVLFARCAQEPNGGLRSGLLRYAP